MTTKIPKKSDKKDEPVPMLPCGPVKKSFGSQKPLQPDPLLERSESSLQTQVRAKPISKEAAAQPAQKEIELKPAPVEAEQKPAQEGAEPKSSRREEMRSEPMEEEEDTSSSSSNEEESSSKPCASKSAAEKKAPEEIEARELPKKQVRPKDTRVVTMSSKASQESAYLLSHAQEMSMAEAEFIGAEHLERAPPILPSRFYDPTLPEDQVIPERQCGFQWSPFGHHKNCKCHIAETDIILLDRPPESIPDEAFRDIGETPPLVLNAENWRKSLNYRSACPILTKSADGKYSTYSLPALTSKEQAAVAT